jgi:hypothetical protein
VTNVERSTSNPITIRFVSFYYIPKKILKMLKSFVGSSVQTINFLSCSVLKITSTCLDQLSDTFVDTALEL